MNFLLYVDVHPWHYVWVILALINIKFDIDDNSSCANACQI
jgi:hypothetical protein